jgi:outer membrane protein assembly factor BamB
VAVLDAATGEERWRTARDEYASWCTPNVDVFGERAQVICNGWQTVGGYDLETGAELWKISGGGDIPVPTPVVAHGLIYLTSAHGRYAPLYAVPYDAEGEIEFGDETLPWFHERGGNYMQTPLVYGEEIYSCRDNGALTCRDALSGVEHYSQRLGDGDSGFSASPVAADGKLYFTSEAGDVWVLRAGTEYELLSQNPMGEECMASPAISDGVLFWRTRGALVAIGPGE